jgi:hypothetical protein
MDAMVMLLLLLLPLLVNCRSTLTPFLALGQFLIPLIL